MPRYVLASSQSGRFHGDTRRIPGADPGTPFDAALALDKAMGRAPRGYGRARKGSRDATLDVYQIDAAADLRSNASDDERLSYARRHGTHVASLISYIS
jgi:hypothetical protein